MKENKYNKIILITIITLVIMLSGCADISITAGVDENFVANYSIDCTVDVIGASAQQIANTTDAMTRLIVYYEENDYTANMSQDNSTMRFTATKSQQCTNNAECFEVLFGYLTDETSPLSEYSYNFTSHYFYDEYSINSKINTNNVINQAVYDTLPDDIKQDVDKYIDDSNIALVFAIPNFEDISQSSPASTEHRIPIKLNTTTPINITGKINNLHNLSDSQSIVNQASYYENLSLILGAIVLVLIIVAILAIVRLTKPKNR